MDQLTGNSATHSYSSNFQHSAVITALAGAPATEFITGAAGSGKTLEIKRRILEDPDYGIVCATTGIAAVNLDGITINSLLGYFDTPDMRDKYMAGLLAATLAQLRMSGAQNLILDEVSMLDAQQLDILHKAAQDSSRIAGVAAAGGSIGIVLTGDFCQLPPVKAPWAFQAQCWPGFENNTVRFEKIWRQDDPGFLQALADARRGAGREAAEHLAQLNVEFTSVVDNNWDGTTIFAKNADVSRYNCAALRKVPGQSFMVEATRWGRQRREWIWDRVRATGIPDQLNLKTGALVMILSNDTPAFNYVNGDLGHIEDYRDGSEPGGTTIWIRLKRTGTVVPITRLTLKNLQVQPPDEWMKAPADEKQASKAEAEARLTGRPLYSWREGKWVVGEITYFPLRLGYATTVHKSQGLTLDQVQIDCRDSFFGEPNMAYVALSQCRRPEALRVVGTPELLARRIRVAQEVLRWI